MPELPDLVYIRESLDRDLYGLRITSADVAEPIVLRMLDGSSAEDALVGHVLGHTSRRGPFLLLDTDGPHIAIHSMLTGRVLVRPQGGKAIAHRRLSLSLENGTTLDYGDKQRMGKFYVGTPEEMATVPGFATQGIDLLSPQLSIDHLREALRRRRQVRVALMDQSMLSYLGNAYADEVLFAAGVHPKAGTHTLDDSAVERLYGAIVSVLRDAIAHICETALRLDTIVRDHVQVRNRKGLPCPRCGTKIRRASVYGFDTFFCPRCQPEPGSSFIRWGTLPGEPAAEANAEVAIAGDRPPGTPSDEAGVDRSTG